jgi:uncharacterized protein (TIGR02268 family)
VKRCSVERQQRAVLLALLVASTVAAAHPHRRLEPASRALYLSKEPDRKVPEVYVAGGVVTTLRFPVPCDPSRTKLLGWESRFEPLLVGGRSVVIVPLKDLKPEDRYLLVVTLADGSEWPFTLTTGRASTDGQVNVYPLVDSLEAVRSRLKETAEENRALTEENRRWREEENSVDHALASLLTNGEVSMTPFVEADKWWVHQHRLDVEILLFVSKRKEPKRKAAVVFKVTNKDPTRPWELQEARLSAVTSKGSLPFALRAAPRSIDAGESGRIAIVMDLAKVGSLKEGEKLVLEIFRDGGYRQWYVELTPRQLRGP